MQMSEDRENIKNTPDWKLETGELNRRCWRWQNRKSLWRVKFFAWVKLALMTCVGGKQISLPRCDRIASRRGKCFVIIVWLQGPPYLLAGCGHVGKYGEIFAPWGTEQDQPSTAVGLCLQLIHCFCSGNLPKCFAASHTASSNAACATTISESVSLNRDGRNPPWSTICVSRRCSVYFDKPSFVTCAVRRHLFSRHTQQSKTKIRRSRVAKAQRNHSSISI